MGPDTTPNDVRFAGQNFLTVFEGCATVWRPCQFPDSFVALDALDSERWTELSGPQIRHEAISASEEDPLLGWSQPIEVISKPS